MTKIQKFAKANFPAADYNPYGTDIKELTKEYDLVFVMSFLSAEYDRDIR